MATEQHIAAYIAGQVQHNGTIIIKKMFGEYAIYADGIVFGFICDDKLFIKPTDAGISFAKNATLAPAYPGSKDYILIEDQIEDVRWLSELVRITLANVPPPKSKKSTKKNKDLK